MRKTEQKPQPIPYPAPPAGLSPRCAALWCELGPSHAKSTGRQILFAEALRALDSAEAARAAIGTDGRTFKTAGGVIHLNPEVKIEIESRRQFASLWADLGLNRIVTSPLDEFLRGR